MKNSNEQKKNIRTWRDVQSKIRGTGSLAKSPVYKTCHNSANKNNADMKLGPVAKNNN